LPNMAKGNVAVFDNFEGCQICQVLPNWVCMVAQ
jgi:hypothetical protein